MLKNSYKVKIDLRRIVTYFVIFLSIFGPKLGGLIDISMITNIMVICFFVCLQNAKMEEYAAQLFLVLLGILFYVILVCIGNGRLNLIFLAKFVRVATSIIALSLYIGSVKLSKETIVNILINVLLLHAVLIIISATVFVRLQNILKPFTGFALYPYRFRATGLTNGFDFAGTLCVFGVLMLGLSPKSVYIRKRTTKLLVFMVAAVLTSRVTMLVLELVIGYMVLKNKKISKKIKGILILMLLVSILPVVGIFLYSTGNYNNLVVKLLLNNSYFATISQKLVYFYASTNIGDTISEHYSFQKLSTWQILLGSMQEANQDPGYTQYIYYIGIVGLMLALVFYMILLLKVKRRISHSSSINQQYLFRVLFCCVGLCVCLSIKNSYLFARHVTEVILILTNIIYKKDIEVS